MDRKVRTITLSAVLTALTVSFLYLANILPAGRLGIIALASLFATAAVIESGIGAAVFVFFGSGILSALILPDKTTALLFALFFGYYPIIKSLAEKIRKAVFSFAVKIAVFNVSLTIVWFIFRKLLFEAQILETNVFIIYALGNIAFILFDIGLTKLIGLYIARISKNLKKDRK